MIALTFLMVSDRPGRRLADDQVAPAKDTEMKEEVLVIEGFEEPSFLPSMQAKVGGFEGEDDPLGRHRVRIEKRFQKQLVH